MEAETLETTMHVSATAEAEDPTGRDRMAWNVLASWAGHFVFIVAGFIMPRLIDHRLGQGQLGLWDFGWTTVSYFGVAGVGVGSSVNKFVAQHRSVNDIEGLRSAVSSVAIIQFGSAIAIVVMASVVTWLLPVLFGSRLGADITTARWVVWLLGLGLAVQMAFDYFRGVMTGCHRWDLHNAINSGSYALTVIAMVGALAAGGGIRSLALANLCGYLLAEVLRAFLAFRICPELQVRLSHVSRQQISQMLRFGVKSLTNGVARLILLQANSLLVAGSLGVAALAVYSRPMALVRHVEALTGKFAFVLTPTASSLQSTGNHRELSDLLVTSTEFAAFLALPLLLGLAIMGDPIMQVWMGSRYTNSGVIAILAGGYFLAVTQQPTLQIMQGLNLHGRLAKAALAAAVGGVLLGIVLVTRLGWGLPGAAIGLGAAMTAGNGLFVASYASRKLGVPITDYLVRAYRRPLGCAVPFAALLLLGRILFAERPVMSLLVGGGAAVTALAITYWLAVLPGLRVAVRGDRLTTRKATC